MKLDRLYIGIVMGMFAILLLQKIPFLIRSFQLGETDSKPDIIRTLLRQSARWSTAASQDENPMIAVLHANYGAGYLYALQDIATPEEIVNATGVDIIKYKNGITGAQDMATVSAIKSCPQFGPEPTYLTSLGGEGKELAKLNEPSV